MVDKTTPHWSYWAIAAVALVWNLMGCINLFTQTGSEAVANMPEAYQALINSRPAWVTGAFAMGVLGGALGAIFMFSRRGQARPLFLLSLIGVTITMVHAFSVTFAASIVMGTGLSFVLGIFLVWYTHRANGRDILN